MRREIVEVTRVDKNMAAEIRNDIKALAKSQQNTEKLLVEHIKTNKASHNEMREIIKKHDAILLGDDVKAGIYKMTFDHAEIVELIKQNQVIENSKEFDKLKIWMQGAVAVGGINILWQVFTYFVPNIQIHLGFLLLQQVIKTVFASN